MIVLVLGGARSGKSVLAERIVTRISEARDRPVTYLATAVASDPDFDARIAAHRARRPAAWRTVEVGAQLAALLPRADGPVLVDSLGTWVVAHPDLAVDTGVLLEALRVRQRAGLATVVVAEEVGLGVHPASGAGRRFRDALGEVNRAVAEIADLVLFVVAGRVLGLEIFDERELDDLLGRAEEAP